MSMCSRMAVGLSMVAGAAAMAQTISHLTFEGQTDGAALTGITESGITWFPFAATAGEEAVGSTLVPDAASRADAADPTTLSADFSPGFGYLETEGDAFSLPDTGWTIECFVRFNAVGGFQTILGRDKDIAESRTLFANMYFQKPTNDSFNVAYFVRFDDNGDGTFTAVYAEANSGEVRLIENKWYHVAATYDAVGPTLRIYVDGELENEVVVPGNIAPVTDPFSQFWTVGRGQYNNNPVDGLNGQIDDLRITGATLAPEDFLVKPTSTGGGDFCLADPNGDGVSNIFDILVFFDAFAAGCD